MGTAGGGEERPRRSGAAGAAGEGRPGPRKACRECGRAGFPRAALPVAMPLSPGCGDFVRSSRRRKAVVAPGLRAEGRCTSAAKKPFKACQLGGKKPLSLV